jgi:hypothetical protein
MCEDAVILDNWGSLYKHSNQTPGYRYWAYHVQMFDKEIIQEIAAWGNGRVYQDRSIQREPNWEATLYGKNLLRFLEYHEPCMMNDAKREIVLDAIYDLREKYGVKV